VTQTVGMLGLAALMAAGCGSASPPVGAGTSAAASAPTSTTRTKASRPVSAARTAYAQALEAFNTQKEDAFLHAHTVDYCHYDRGMSRSALKNHYAKHFNGRGNAIEAKLRVVASSNSRVVFLQAEWFRGSDTTDGKRFFKFIAMQRRKGRWLISATGTRARHACAPDLVKGVDMARVDRYKQRIRAKDTQRRTLLAKLVPPECTVSVSKDWDGVEPLELACDGDVEHGKCVELEDTGPSAGTHVTGRTCTLGGGWVLEIRQFCYSGDEVSEECETVASLVPPE